MPRFILPGAHRYGPMGAGVWTPENLGSDLGEWWTPSYGITKNGVTDRVSSWVGRVAGVDLVNADGARQPRWEANVAVMNGRQALYFDAARWLGVVTLPVALRVTQQAHTYLAVSRGAGDVLGTGATSTGNMLLMRYNQKVRTHVWAAANVLTTKDGATSVAVTTAATFAQMATGVPGTGTLVPVLNGAADATPLALNGTATTPSTSFVVGSRGFAAGADTFLGYMGDVLLMKREMTALELTWLHTYLAARWGMP